MISSGIIFGNKIVDVVFVATFAAQIYKCFSPLLKGKRIDLTRMFATGGMPSSHSSSTAALCTAVGMVRGMNTIEFAIAFVLAVITMYDATGIRQEAGKHAKIINTFILERNVADNEKNIKNEIKELKEFLGHTPLEVGIGALVGIIIAILMKGYLLS